MFTNLTSAQHQCRGGGATSLRPQPEECSPAPSELQKLFSLSISINLACTAAAAASTSPASPPSPLGVGSSSKCCCQASPHTNVAASHASPAALCTREDMKRTANPTRREEEAFGVEAWRVCKWCSVASPGCSTHSTCVLFASASSTTSCGTLCPRESMFCTEAKQFSVCVSCPFLWLPGANSNAPFCEVDGVNATRLSTHLLPAPIPVDFRTSEFPVPAKEDRTKDSAVKERQDWHSVGAVLMPRKEAVAVGWLGVDV